MSTDDKLRIVAVHEAGHVCAAENLGIRVAGATLIPNRDRGSNGSATLAVPRPESLDMLVVLDAGHAATQERDLDDPEGPLDDYKQAGELVRRLANGDDPARINDLWIEAKARARELVREPCNALIIDRLADEFVRRAERGFGISSREIGEVIAAARAEYESSQRLYGLPAPVASLDGTTPSEELAMRAAVVAEIGAPETGRARPKARPSRPETKPSRQAAHEAIKVRLAATSPALRAQGNGRTLTGHFAVFNDWVEIDSNWEGRFMERFAPGAFLSTMAARRDRIRCIFQHGYDATCGDKPLGPIVTLREDQQGAFYEVPLLDTSYVGELVPGLEAGLYGASFKFRVVREDFNREPGASSYNPNGLPERTVRECELFEFGPVTFPAYPNATAGVRSLTDWYRSEWISRQPVDNDGSGRVVLMPPRGAAA